MRLAVDTKQLTQSELRPLLASAVGFHASLPALSYIEELNLSNCAVEGDEALDLLSYIPPTATPVALRCLDLCGNSLGDDGAIKLALFVEQNAKKLKNLVEVRLDSNSIGDQGALSLATVIHEELSKSHLPKLSTVSLQSNELSEAVQQTTQAELKQPRDLPSEPPVGVDCAERFGKLLKKEVKAIKRKHVDDIASHLGPLATFLKRLLWRHVASKRNINRDTFVVRLYPTPTDPTNQLEYMSLHSSVFDSSGVERGFVRDFIDTSPKLQACMELVEIEREKAMRVVSQRALEDCDPLNLLVISKDDEHESDRLVVQINELHRCVAEAVEAVSRFAAKLSKQDACKDYLSGVLAESLGMTVKVIRRRRTWFVKKYSYSHAANRRGRIQTPVLHPEAAFEDIENDRRVLIFPNLAPFLGNVDIQLVGGRIGHHPRNASADEFEINQENGFEITCSMPQ